MMGTFGMLIPKCGTMAHTPLYVLCIILVRILRQNCGFDIKKHIILHATHVIKITHNFILLTKSGTSLSLNIVIFCITSAELLQQL